MLKNYIKIALRNLSKNKIFTIINLAGLSVGIACSMLILLWVQNELSYDNFNKNGDNIYRVLYKIQDSPELIGTSPGLLAPEAKKTIPEIVDAARIMKRPKMVIKAVGNSLDEPAFYEEFYYLVDPSLFKIFNLPFIEGNPETALETGMVITKNIALKYFGTTDVIGKRLNVNNWFDVSITGVIQDIPQNSHFNFEMFTRLEDLRKYFPNGFTWSNAIHQTYVQLAPNSDVKSVENKLTVLNNENNKNAVINNIEIQLQPLKDIYLDAEVSGTTVKHGDKNYVYIFSIIAFLILLIGCINFINLSTAHISSRIRSIGIFKLIGAERTHLFKQILGESILMSFLAALFAVVMVELALPAFNSFSGKNLAISIINPANLIIFFLLILSTGLLAGAFPAVYFSRFKPIDAFRTKWINSRKGGLRKTLVITQFTAAVFLIIVTLVISGQLDFLRDKKLGFQKDNVICLPVKANIGNHYQSFRNELLNKENIVNIGLKNSITTEPINHTNAWWEAKDPNKKFISEIDDIDFNFFKTLKLKIIEGRDFSENFPTDLSAAFILNEKAVKEMGLKNPVGKRLKAGNKDGYIVGVVKDANFRTLKEPVQPIIYTLANDFTDEGMDLFGVIYISIKPQEIPNTIKYIEKTWNKFNPDYPFEYTFLDDTYNNLYKSEANLADIFSMFTFLALFVTIMGMFGLASFMADQRTKEIGIRKVLGASVINIFLLLSGNFVRSLIIANLIAFPLAWYVMQKWLQSYSYHTEISLLIFIIAGGLTLIVTLSTISIIVFRAATTNPIESLRYE